MSIENQVSELITVLKQQIPTQHEQLHAELVEAKRRKDFSAVVRLSNQLAQLGSKE